TASVPMFDAFPHMLQNFRSQYPRIELSLRHLSTGEQLQALNAGDIDVGFLRPSSSFKAPPSLETTELWRDELMLAVGQHHPLAKATRPIKLERLSDEDFILFPQASGCGLFEHISTLTAQAGFTPNIVQEVRENSTTLALVAAGLGVSIVPSIYTHTKPPGVVFKPLHGAPTQSRIVMACSRENPNASLALFLAHVRATPGEGGSAEAGFAVQ